MSIIFSNFPPPSRTLSPKKGRFEICPAVFFLLGGGKFSPPFLALPLEGVVSAERPGWRGWGVVCFLHLLLDTSAHSVVGCPCS